MKKNKAFNVALATTLAASAVVAVAPTQADASTLSFKDVSETNTFYNDIMQLAERGIVKGYPNGNFGPYDAVKRGQAAKILAGLLGLDTTNVKNPNFKDVSTTNQYYGAIAALQNAGIISGKADGTYGINDSLTRGQMAKILTLGFKLQGEATSNPFKDIENSGFKNNILALLENGVTVGTTPTTFSPNSAVTRGQLTAFVLRAEKATQSEEKPEEKPNEKPEEKPEETPKEPVVPVTPVTPGTPGSTGGSGGSVNSLDSAVDEVISAAIGEFKIPGSYAEVIPVPTSNVVKFKVSNGDIPLSKVKEDMAAFESVNTIEGIKKNESLNGIGVLFEKFESVTSSGETYDMLDLLNRDFTKNLILSFVDTHQDGKTTLGELKGQSTNLTVNFNDGSSLNYTLIIE